MFNCIRLQLYYSFSFIIWMWVCACPLLVQRWLMVACNLFRKKNYENEIVSALHSLSMTIFLCDFAHPSIGVRHDTIKKKTNTFFPMIILMPIIWFHNPLNKRLYSILLEWPNEYFLLFVLDVERWQKRRQRRRERLVEVEEGVNGV